MLRPVALCFRILFVAAVVLLVFGSAASVRANAMTWEGEHKTELGPPVHIWITGSGATDGFGGALPGWTGPRSHWVGRPIWGVDPDSGLPGVVETQGPMPGDSLSFDGRWVDIHLNGEPAIKKDIFGATHTGMGPVGFAIYATITGGTIQSDDSIGVGNQEKFDSFDFYPDEHRFLPFDAVGVNWSAPTIGIGTLNYINLDSGTVLSGEVVNISGGQHGLYPLPAGQEAKVQLRLVSEIHASELNVYQLTQSPFVFNVEEASVLQGLGMSIGSNANTANGMAEVRLQSDSEANFEQYITVGNTGPGTFTLKSSAKVNSPNAYEVVGLDATGFMHVADHAEVRVDDLQVGVRSQGDVAIDTDGKVFTNKATLGSVVGFEGSVNIQDNGRWDTTDITIGDSGTGWIYVRQNGTLKINGEGVLGKEASGTGILNLIGSTAKLELGASGSLKIGKEGHGELNLSEGAQFTSISDVRLGDLAKSAGIVTVDGEGSKWTAAGQLHIGENSVGKVTIRNGGVVDAQSEIIFVGKEAEGDGELVVDGGESKFDFTGELYVGYAGKGQVSLQDGASYTTDDLILGYEQSGTGKLFLENGHTKEFTVNGNMTVGRAGVGQVFIYHAYQLNTAGNAVLGELAGSGAADVDHLNLVVVAGEDARWEVSEDVTIAKSNGSYAGLNVTDQGIARVAGDLKAGIEQGSNAALLVRDTTGSHPSGGRAKVTVEGTVEAGINGIAHIVVDKKGTLNAGELSLGTEANGYGQFDVANDGSRVSISGDFAVGGLGRGVLNVTDKGRVSTSGELLIDSAVADGAKVTVSQGPATDSDESMLDAATLVIAEHHSGSLTVQQSGNVNTNTLQMGRTSNGIGQLDVKTQGQVTATSLDANIGGTAEINITEGGRLSVDDARLSKATVTIDNGTFNAKRLYSEIASSFTLSNSGAVKLKDGGFFQLSGTASQPAVLNIHSGAAVTIETSSGAGTHFDAGTSGNATVNIDSGGSIHAETVLLGSVGGSIPATMTVSGASSYINSVFLTVQGVATLTASGGATIQAQRSATLNGIADVLGGALWVGTSSVTSTPVGAVVVFPNGILKGRGTIKGDLYALDPKSFPNVTGARKPLVALGTSPGILTVEGNVVLEEDTVLEMEIGGSTPGAQYDQLLATGSITVSGVLDLAIVNAGSGFQLPSVGNQFTLLSATGGVAGAFENAASLRSIAGGSRVDWSINSTATSAMLQAVAITPLTDGDYNGDGAVDAADYVVWRHTAGGINLAADGNRDGVVNNLDYNLWRAHFGGAMGSGAMDPDFSSVPEPATALLCVVGLALATRARRR